MKAGLGRTPTPERSQKTTKRKSRGRRQFTSATRFAASGAEQFLDAQSSLIWDADPSEFDDAPRDDEVPDGYHDDEDPGLFDEDEGGPTAPRSSWVPWVRLAIFEQHGSLRFVTSLPVANRTRTESSLSHLENAWKETAQVLIEKQSVALRCRTPLDAMRALERTPMETLERSAGQGSRDRRVVLSTPFGLVPLWFFAQGRADNLFQDLEQIGRAAIATGAQTVSPKMIKTLIPNPTLNPESIRRAHGMTLVAVGRQPEIVARHRALWPLTTTGELLDDLGVVDGVGRSAAVAFLALVGAFDPPSLLLSAAVPTRPRREVTP